MSRSSRKIAEIYRPDVPQTRRELRELDHNYYPSIINLHIEEKETGEEYLPEPETNEMAGLSQEERRHKTFLEICLLYTSPSPRDRQKTRMPSSA